MIWHDVKSSTICHGGQIWCGCVIISMAAFRYLEKLIVETPQVESFAKYVKYILNNISLAD